MALQVQWEMDTGASFNQAHAVVKVARVVKSRAPEEVDANSGEVTHEAVDTYKLIFKVGIWVNETAYNEYKPEVDGYNGEFELNRNSGKTQYNIIKQCYNHLKTLDGWETATDKI